MKKPEYTVDYFIKKFSKIPDEEIGTGQVNHHCALWHCGVRDNSMKKLTDEAKALAAILHPLTQYKSVAKHEAEIVYDINDRTPAFAELGKTPKQRLLNALKKVKATT